MHSMELRSFGWFVFGWVVVLTVAGSVSSAAGQSEDLWSAARAGDAATIRELLARGVPVDTATEFDCTALYFAVNANRAEAARVLIEAGANVDVQDNSYGYTAMGMAAWLGHSEMIAILLDAGAQPGGAVGGFFAAVSNGHAEAAQVFVERGLIPQAQLDGGLALALRNGSDAVAAMLVAAGAKPPEPEAANDPAPGGEGGDGSADGAESGDEPKTKPVAEETPQRVARPANWPEFRGAGRTGVADGQHPPLSWSLVEETNVAWRTAVEGHGYSSPIVWGDRVFITTAIAPTAEQTIEDGGLGWIDAVAEHGTYRWELHAYDLSSGKLVWKRELHSGVPRSQRHWKASQANPTCATDGKIVVALLGSEGLHAYRTDGTPLWSRDLGELNAGWYIDATFQWGYASSPAIFDGKVFVQADVHGQSFVAAFSLSDGKELWRTPRDEIPAWGTPLVYRDRSHAELVLNATHAVVGYDPATGKELWRIRGNSTITVASPIAGDGLILATGGYREPKPIYAVKPGARGDVTPDEAGKSDGLLWSRQTDGVYIVTPLVYRGVLYLLRANGVLTAMDPATGEEHYKQRLGSSFTASPVAAEGRIYFTGEGGDVIVVQAGTEYRELARNELDASTLASPAISNGRIVFRTVRGLLAFGGAGTRAASAPH